MNGSDAFEVEDEEETNVNAEFEDELDWTWIVVQAREEPDLRFAEERFVVYAVLLEA